MRGFLAGLLRDLRRGVLVLIGVFAMCSCASGMGGWNARRGCGLGSLISGLWLGMAGQLEQPVRFRDPPITRLHRLGTLARDTESCPLYRELSSSLSFPRNAFLFLYSSGDVQIWFSRQRQQSCPKSRVLARGTQPTELFFLQLLLHVKAFPAWPCQSAGLRPGSQKG